MNNLLRVRTPRVLALCLGLLVAALIPSSASALTITNVKAGPVDSFNNNLGLPFNPASFGDAATDANCMPTKPSPTLSTQAGGNTDYCITFNLGSEDPTTGEDVHDTLVQLPVGTQGDIDNAAKCSLAQFGNTPAANTCPPESQVGTIAAMFAIGAPANTTTIAPGRIYALDTPSDKAALLGVALFGTGGLQSKYTITVSQLGNPQIGLQNQSSTLARETVVSASPLITAPVSLRGSSIRFWGKASDHLHPNATNTGLVYPAANFMRVGSTCQTDQTLTLTVNPYTDSPPGAQSATQNTTYKLTGCENLGFSPTFTAGISGETQPGGHPQLDVNITVPDGNDDLGAARVTLPTGIATDLSRIQDSCPQATFEAAGCPESATIGTVTASLNGIADGVLQGDVIKVKVDGKQLPGIGLNFKGRLPLRVLGISEVDSQGRLVNTFVNLPSLPQRALHITLFGGSKGILQTDPTGKCTASAYEATLGSQNQKAKAFSIATTCTEQLSATLSNSTKSKPVLLLGSAGATGKKVKSLRIGLPKGLKFDAKNLKNKKKVTYAGMDTGVKASDSKAAKVKAKAKFTFPDKGTNGFSVLTHTGVIKASSSFAKSTAKVYVEFRIVYQDGSKVTKYVELKRAG